jgi:tRNA 2-thiouridine synthesizing protein A
VTDEPAIGGEARPSRSVTVDAVGRRCPQPIIDLARAAAGASAGTRLVLLADDPAAHTDVAAWCRMRGHRLVAAEPDAAPPRYLVEVSDATQPSVSRHRGGGADNAAGSSSR